MATASTVPIRRSGAPVRGLRAEVVEGPDLGKSAVSEGPCLSIGVASDNDLVLTDATVSRYHVELIRSDRAIQLEDLGSTNGTLLEVGNRQVQLSKATLEPGLVVRLGNTKLRVDDGEVSEIEALKDDRWSDMVGRSPSMRTLMARLERAAHSDTSVLILGETGVGKEMVAQSIHEQSKRSNGPFETIDCGALLPTLVNSELFGHEKGSFTGADSKYAGAFQRAQGGTLFLDEIGELPKETQTALLGALERRQIRPVGGERAIPVDVRVLAATHRDLRMEVNAGGFRQDLYYRLAVVMVRVPPLRERSEDIPLLVEHFATALGQQGRAAELFTPEVIKSLKSHQWPGNVRELRNYVEAALALGESPSLNSDDAEVLPSTWSTDLVDRKSYHELRDRVLWDFEQEYLTALLERHGGNISSASRVASVNRNHLTALLRRHNIHPRSSE